VPLRALTPVNTPLPAQFLAMTELTADLYDNHRDALLICDVPLRNFGGRTRFHGRIRTVRCHEDNALLKGVLGEPGRGHVLVIDGGGSLHRALMGDNVASIAARSGWSGVVIFGAIRDSAAIAGIDLGVKALGTMPRSPRKTGAGEVDVPVKFGGIEFAPGGHLYSDEDGLVVLPAT
jgi:regulator of ribonuclease activity A